MRREQVTRFRASPHLPSEVTPSSPLVPLPRPARGVSSLLLTLLLTGCATVRSYDNELQQTLSLASSGNLDAAIKTLGTHGKKGSKDMLYYLELGELQRLDMRYDQSQSAWLQADQSVQEWEASAKADPEKVAGAVASYVLNDKLRPYQGEDFEKVLLTTRMALNFLAQGDWENARVAIKQTHEREAVISDVRARQYAEVEEQARKHGARTSFKELNGYPVASIDNPEVNALRNSYQSAFSHYLAGFIYEALGEPSLAAAGYRQANELRPGTPLLEEALAGLDERVARAADDSTEVLLSIETGLAPARTSQRFSLPIPVENHIVLIPVSFPVLKAQDPGLAPQAVILDGGKTSLTPVLVTNVDAMSRRALQDEMPGIMLRGFIRSTAKAVAQYETQRKADEARRKGDDGAAAALEAAAIGLMVGSVATETADERGWRSLPASISVARAKLPRGRHHITLNTASGPQDVEVNIQGRYAFVALRTMGGRLFASLPKAAPPAGSQSARAPRQESRSLPSSPTVRATSAQVS